MFNTSNFLGSLQTSSSGFSFKKLKSGVRKTMWNILRSCGNDLHVMTTRIYHHMHKCTVMLHTVLHCLEAVGHSAVINE